MPAKVLIPVDGARNSKTAEEHAVMLHKLMPMSVLLLNVINTKDVDWHGLDPGYKESILKAKRKMSDKVVAEARAVFKNAGIEVETRIEEGDPGVLICRTASTEGFDMVIMAESGRTELQDWFMGSVTNFVLYKCGVPLLLVKHSKHKL